MRIEESGVDDEGMSDLERCKVGIQGVTEEYRPGVKNLEELVLDIS